MAKSATVTTQTSSARKSPTSHSGGRENYLQTVVAEGKKITWPTVPQIVANTITVVLMTALFSTGLWLMDTIFRAIINFLTQTLPNIVG